MEWLVGLRESISPSKPGKQFFEQSRMFFHRGLMGRNTEKRPGASQGVFL